VSAAESSRADDWIWIHYGQINVGILAGSDASLARKGDSARGYVKWLDIEMKTLKGSIAHARSGIILG